MTQLSILVKVLEYLLKTKRVQSYTTLSFLLLRAKQVIQAYDRTEKISDWLTLTQIDKIGDRELNNINLPDDQANVLLRHFALTTIGYYYWKGTTRTDETLNPDSLNSEAWEGWVRSVMSNQTVHTHEVFRMDQGRLDNQLSHNATFHGYLKAFLSYDSITILQMAKKEVDNDIAIDTINMFLWLDPTVITAGYIRALAPELTMDDAILTTLRLALISTYDLKTAILEESDLLDTGIYVPQLLLSLGGKDSVTQADIDKMRLFPIPPGYITGKTPSLWTARKMNLRKQRLIVPKRKVNIDADYLVTETGDIVNASNLDDFKLALADSPAIQDDSITAQEIRKFYGLRTPRTITPKS